MASKTQNPKKFKSPASKFGQMIGEVFAEVVDNLIAGHIEARHPEYELLKGKAGALTAKLSKVSGTELQIDTIIVAKAQKDPVALLESKWLKDARHHNDKGGWILQLPLIKRKKATIRGLVAVLAGYWTRKMEVVFLSDGDVKMIHIADDEEVYSTLQKPLDEYLGTSTFTLDAKQMRQSYPRVDDLVNFLLDLQASDRLKPIAQKWLQFKRKDGDQLISGSDRIKHIIDEMLAPLPTNPAIKKFEIALQIETGNTIYQEFADIEDALDFMQKYAQNPQAILEKIKPKGVA